MNAWLCDRAYRKRIITFKTKKLNYVKIMNKIRIDKVKKKN